MAQRVSEEIDGIDVFTYDTDLLAVVMKDYRKPELLELAKLRNYPGVWKLNKLELAIIVADRLTAERDEQRKLDEVNEQMTETLDEIAPIPARTLREDVPFPRPTADELDEQAATGAARTERDELIERGRAAGLMEGFSHRFPENDALRRAVDFAESSRAEEAQRVDALIEQLDGNPAEPVDKPRTLDIWLEPGVLLISPRDGERYRFERWVGGTAVLVNQDNGALVRVPQYDVRDWQYLPKASAAGVAEAKRRVPWRRTFVEHMASRQVYEVLGMDNILTGKLFLSHACGTECSGHERAVSPEVLRVDYIACDKNGNRFVQPSAPTYAVGDRVRWTEDRRPMFVRQVGFTGVSVSPTPDGTYTALARFEDLSPYPARTGAGEPGRIPDTRDAWKAYAEKVKASRDAAEAKVSELLIENGTLKEQNGRWAVEASDAIAELGRLRQRLLWMIGHWQTQGRGTTVPVEDIAMALRDSR